MQVLKYKGPHDAVEVEVAPRVWATVARNATIEVADNLAGSLLEQVDNWTTATKKAAKAVSSED